ncbi:hypothetical protein HMPREF3038_02749 [Akkermansia sp. KLE1797]|nr:hypothetical protein HMPREF3038_02749 [Akkermansia sp. KLE1797]KZA03789.1 hypothetical protein HMPREF1326_02562 [Akkermansia sp. KLE1605]
MFSKANPCIISPCSGGGNGPWRIFRVRPGFCLLWTAWNG